MRKYTVDSISQGLARLLLRENETEQYVVPVDQLPPGACEGDIISAEIVGDVVVRATREPSETKVQQEKIQALLTKLKNKPRR